MASPSAPLGLRERKNLRTRKAIVQATAELTIEGGYAAATIPRIAERADVSPRTVSTWFPNKDDIFFEGSDELVARGTAHIRDGDGDVVDRILAWFDDEADRYRDDREFSQLRRAAILHDPELRARYWQHLSSIQTELAAAVARDTGGQPDGLGPQLVSGAAMVFFDQLGSSTAAQSEEESAEKIRIGTDFLRAGLRSISGAAG